MSEAGKGSDAGTHPQPNTLNPNRHPGQRMEPARCAHGGLQHNPGACGDVPLQQGFNEALAVDGWLFAVYMDSGSGTDRRYPRHGT